MITKALLLGALVALVGCAPRARFVDTKTVHDASASRLWIIQDIGGDDHHIVLCDIAMFQHAGTLCMRATIAQAPPGRAPVPGSMFPPAPPPAAAPPPPR